MEVKPAAAGPTIEHYNIVQMFQYMKDHRSYVRNLSSWKTEEA